MDPVIPSAWEGFEAERRFRDAMYRIRVRKPAGATGRVSSLTVDGKPLEGTVVPAAPAGTTVVVEGSIG